MLETQAQITAAAGDQAASRDLAVEALQVAEETGNEKATVSSLLSLARATRALGDPTEAAGIYERAVELARGSAKPGLIRSPSASGPMS